jgi:ABC-type Fe3+ transport system substrate-binding protein
VAGLLAALLAACGPSGAPRAGSAPAPAAPPPASGPSASGGPAQASAGQAEWERTLQAARQEGKVIVNGPTGAGPREALVQFQKAYPDITLELQILGGRDFGPRVLAERRGDQYLWDLLIGGAGTPAQTLKPEGVLDPLEPAVLPENRDDSKWLNGFRAGFYDVEKSHVYAFSASLRFLVYVNRDVVSESELNRVEDLIDPKWRGKIVSDDVLAFGSGCGTAGHLIQVLGDDWVRKLFAQDLTITRDKRQPIEWLVRGRYPIAMGVDEPYLEELQRQGLGRNVKVLAPESDAGVRVSQQSGAVTLINRPANPNAQKVFLNWLLSKDGQNIWSKHTQENSRRLDVTEGPAETRPDPKRQYHGDVAREDLLYLPNQCVDIAKDVIKQ